MHWLQCLNGMFFWQELFRQCKMCKKYEKQFLNFLKDRKIGNGENERNLNIDGRNDKKKIQNHLVREISSSLQRSIAKAKNLSKELEAQRHYVR